MYRHTTLLILLTLTIAGNTFSQRVSGRPNGMITGQVFDSYLKTPVEYASVTIYNQHDSSQLTGIITDEQGFFKLTGIRPGLFFIKISFMGYTTKTISDIVLTRGSFQIDLGDIPLERSVTSLEDVEVSAEKPLLEYHIDKKVVNVSQHYSAASGTAVDILENIPSVTVDIDGNVQLRGSGNFTVLIDNRPSVLEANEALEQIPASAIDNIEIITNPSAKYDPEGTSGIINIILKKNQLRGTGGIVNLNAGLNDKYGGDILLNYRRGIVSATFGADFRRDYHPGTSDTESRTTYQGTTSYINSEGDSKRGRNGAGLRGSLDFNLSSRDNLGLGFRYGSRAMLRDGDYDYDEWSEPALQHLYYFNISDMERTGDFYAVHTDYRHRFTGKGHEISAMIYYHSREMEEESKNELIDADGDITSGRITREEGPGNRLGLRLDYTLPLNGKDKFEAGYEGRMGNSEDNTSLRDLDVNSGQYLFQPQYSHDIEYERDNHALYALYAGEWGDFGWQGGLRGEYTYRLISLVGEDEEFSLDRWDYFPTAHISYQLPRRKQVMASYSRRIVRPRGYYLEPFETWSDAYNVRMGNPGLKPEYIDSYEMGYKTHFKKSLVSFEAYYRVTHNSIERVHSVYAENVTLHTVANVGTGYDTGLEVMTNGDILPGWNINLMGNLFNHRIEGEVFGESFSRESFNWRLRLNNAFKVTKTTKLQIIGTYNSPSVTSEGERAEFFVTDLAVKQEFLKGDLTATLQLRDVFSTGKYEFTSEGTDFYSHRYYTREAPMVMLNLSYNINNYKPEREKRQGLNDIDTEEDF